MLQKSYMVVAVRDKEEEWCAAIPAKWFSTSNKSVYYSPNSQHKKKQIDVNNTFLHYTNARALKFFGKITSIMRI